MQNIEQDLNYLLDLQEIDKQIDAILQLRGELPQEVTRIENELGALESQARTCQESITDAEQIITTSRIQIKDLESSITRYEEQQSKIRNSREYDAITKELELHQLDIQLAEKKIKTTYDHLANLKKDQLAIHKIIDSTTETLKSKKDDLGTIITTSQIEQEQLTKKRNKSQSHITKNLVQMYESIRNHLPNKLGIVKVKDGACEGCFTIVYPQLQADIQEKKAILCCEHCGRILGDVTNVTILGTEEEMGEE